MTMPPRPDEAQTVVPPAPADDEAEPFLFSITLRTDATVSVNGQNWIKPGAEATHTWRIRHGVMPSREEMELKMVYIQDRVLTPVITDVVETISKLVVEMQQQR